MKRHVVCKYSKNWWRAPKINRQFIRQNVLSWLRALFKIRVSDEEHLNVKLDVHRVQLSKFSLSRSLILYLNLPLPLSLILSISPTKFDLFRWIRIKSISQSHILVEIVVLRDSVSSLFFSNFCKWIDITLLSLVRLVLYRIWML